jgi:hypothetical protein
MKKFFMFLIPMTLILFLSPLDSIAMMHGQGHHMGRYGGYCKGPKWGWYGAGRSVRTEKEVRELVAEFLKETELTAGQVRDEKTYFEVEIKDGDGEVVDLLIVDKRTCRMRSAY